MILKSNKPFHAQFTAQNWWKTGIGWGLFVWFWMEVYAYAIAEPSLFNGEMQPKSLLIWLAGGFLYSASGYLLFGRKQKSQIQND